jgi:hypothetical protein
VWEVHHRAPWAGHLQDAGAGHRWEDHRRRSRAAWEGRHQVEAAGDHHQGEAGAVHHRDEGEAGHHQGAGEDRLRHWQRVRVERHHQGGAGEGRRHQEAACLGSHTHVRRD